MRSQKKPRAKTPPSAAAPPIFLRRLSSPRDEAEESFDVAPHDCESPSCSEEEQESVAPLVALACAEARPPSLRFGDYSLLRTASGSSGATFLGILGWSYNGTEDLALLQHMRNLKSVVEEALRELCERRRTRRVLQSQVAAAARAGEEGALFRVEARCVGLQQAVASRALWASLPARAAENVMHFCHGPGSRAALWALLRLGHQEESASQKPTTTSFPAVAWTSEEDAEKELERRALTQHLALAFRKRLKDAPQAAEVVQKELLVSKAHWASVLDSEMLHLSASVRSQLVDTSIKRATFAGRARHFDADELRRNARELHALAKKKKKRGRDSQNAREENARGRRRGRLLRGPGEKFWSQKKLSKVRAALLKNRALPKKKNKKEEADALRQARRSLLLGHSSDKESWLRSLREVRDCRCKQRSACRCGGRMRARRLGCARVALLNDRAMVRLWLLPTLRRRRPPCSPFAEKHAAAARVWRFERKLEARLAHRLARLRRIWRARDAGRVHTRAAARRHEQRSRELYCRTEALTHNKRSRLT